MEPIEFKSAVVERSASETIVIALFDGEPVPECVGIFSCDETAAAALLLALFSILEPER